MLTLKKAAGLALLFAALGLLGACATPSPASEPLVSGEVDLNEVICHEEQRTGTRFSRKVCKTRKEWEDEAADNQDAKRNIGRSAVPREDRPKLRN